MNTLEKTLVCAAVLSTLLATQSAIACTPPPPYILNPVSAEEFKLPKGAPGSIFTTGMSCPQVVWPFVFHGLTDTQIAQYLGTTTPPVAAQSPVPTPTPTPTPPPSSTPTWESTKVYVAGDKVSYGGKVYAARWWTQGEIPSSTSAVWDEQADIFGNPPTWYATKAYSGGAKVTYGTKIYSAKWWTQGETPGVAGNAWSLIGTATGRRPALFHVTAAYGNGVDANGNSILKLSWNTDWTTLASAPLADNWKVKVNGVVVQQGGASTIAIAHSDCASNTPSCESQYSQKGFFFVPSIRKEQLTFWLCTGNACRPTPRVAWTQGGSDGPAPNTLP